MRYDAFISYRHSDLDMYIAKKVHKGLETFKVPRAVAKKSGKKNIKRVFRDQEELPIGSDLGDNIEGALAESEFLLVICSPRTPESYWVQKEIDTFIKMHGREHVLAILIEGEPDQSFPSQLLVDEAGSPVEPLAADVRGNTKSEINKKMRTEIMRLAAPLLQCTYDDLRQRHKERRMKKMIGAVSAAAVLGIAFGVYSAYNTAMIQKNYEEKQINQSKYLADTAMTLLEEGDRQTAALVALEALPTEKNDRPYVANAQYALSRILNCYDTGNVIGMDRALKHDLPVSNFSINEEGTEAVSVDQGDYIYVWDLENGGLLAKLSPELDESSYVISPMDTAVADGHIIVGDQNGVHAVNFVGEEEWRAEEGEYFIDCKIDTEAGVAACVSNDVVVFYDIADGHEVGRMENQLESSYTTTMAFSDDKQKFAVAHLLKEGSSGSVTVYDFTTGTMSDCVTAAAYIMDVSFTADNVLVVASCPDVRESEGSAETAFVQKIDDVGQSVLWQNEFLYQEAGLDSASLQLKTRKYVEEESGVTVDQVLMSVNNTAYAWDTNTGALVSQVAVSGGIKTFLVARSSGVVYLAEGNGTIDLVDMNTGMNYTNLAIETGKNLQDIDVKNGILIIKAYASPSLTVMKYHKGTGMKELQTYGESIENVCYSRDETYYAVCVSEEGFYFYGSSEDNFISEWSPETQEIFEVSGFVNDTVFVVIDTNGNIFFYDVSSGEEEKMVPSEEFSVVNCDLNGTGTKAVIYGGSMLYVVDLEKREVQFSKDIEEYVYGASLSEDGKAIYCKTKESGICIIDTEKESVTPLKEEGYELANGIMVKKSFSISKDRSLLAVSCRDNMLRVWDTDEKKTVAEIPFASVSRRFVQFSEDGSKVMLQGDDYYFRVYDLEKQEFSHISVEQYNEITKAIADEKSETVSLVTTADVIILNGESYERVAEINKGLSYLPEQNVVLCKYSDTLYRFPYMNLDMLLEEAQNQFGEVVLSEQERIQYHVD